MPLGCPAPRLLARTSLLCHCYVTVIACLVAVGMVLQVRFDPFSDFACCTLFVLGHCQITAQADGFWCRGLQICACLTYDTSRRVKRSEVHRSQAPREAIPCHKGARFHASGDWLVYAAGHGWTRRIFASGKPVREQPSSRQGFLYTGRMCSCSCSSSW